MGARRDGFQPEQTPRSQHWGSSTGFIARPGSREQPDRSRLQPGRRGYTEGLGTRGGGVPRASGRPQTVPWELTAV